MRVALVSPLFESVPPKLYGGTERVVHALCRGLRDSGIEVVVFASGDSAVAEEPGIELVPVVDRALRLLELSAGETVPYSLRLVSEVARRAGAFDLIHNHHDYWLLPLASMLGSRKPLLTTVHGRLDLPDIGAIYGLESSAKFVSISDAQRAPMPQLPWIKTIHHGIDTSQFKFEPRAGKYLAFLGRIHSDKRPEWAIEIARLAGIPLKIAAKVEGPEGRAYYDTFIRPHVDGKNVEFVGEIGEAEKSEFLGGALGSVFPIDWPEPFGLVLIESLACGTPVLARPCGAVPEILQDGVTGFIDLDIRALARRATELGAIDRQVCRNWVETHFSLRRMTEDYIDVYRQLVSAAAAPSRKRRGGGRHRRNLLYSVERAADRDT